MSERALNRALLTPVPEGLADRIIFQSRNPRPAWRAWTLAASVVLAAALGFSLWNPRESTDHYARLAIEHVVTEPESLSNVRNADPEALTAVMRDIGASLRAPLGRVRYIRLCPVEDTFGWHIVFETHDGLATLILVPGKALREPETAIFGDWSALVRPARSGYYAIVTASAASTWRFNQLLQEHVDWARS